MTVARCCLVEGTDDDEDGKKLLRSALEERRMVCGGGYADTAVDCAGAVSLHVLAENEIRDAAIPYFRRPRHHHHRLACR